MLSLTHLLSLTQRDNHVPFRNSKLTQLLADSLSGQAKCMMFMHVSPEGSFASETVSTLNFGSKVSTITLGQVRFILPKLFYLTAFAYGICCTDDISDKSMSSVWESFSLSSLDCVCPPPPSVCPQAKRQVDNSKFFANEEVIRSRKEVQEKDEQLLNLHRKWQEESKQREHLQKEVERLKVRVARLWCEFVPLMIEAKREDPLLPTHPLAIQPLAPTCPLRTSWTLQDAAGRRNPWP